MLDTFQELKHLEFEIVDTKIPESIFTLHKLETLCIGSNKEIVLPHKINYLSELKSLTIKGKCFNMGGLFNLNKYLLYSEYTTYYQKPQFQENDKNNNEYHIYGHSIVIFDYVYEIEIPTYHMCQYYGQN